MCQNLGFVTTKLAMSHLSTLSLIVCHFPSFSCKIRARDGFRLSLLMIVDIKLNRVHHDNHNLYLRQFQLWQTCKESNLTFYAANCLSAAWRLKVYVSYKPTAFTPQSIFSPSAITVALGASARHDYKNARISFTTCICPYVRSAKRETIFST